MLRDAVTWAAIFWAAMASSGLCQQSREVPAVAPASPLTYCGHIDLTVYGYENGDPVKEFRAGYIHHYLINPKLNRPIGAAWYVPNEGNQLQYFEWINVRPDTNQPDRLVLSVAAAPNTDGRLGLRIHMLCEG